MEENLKAPVLEQILVMNQPFEEALRQSEERYRSLVEESFDAVFIHDGIYITFANKRAYEMFGYEKGAFQGLDFRVLSHPDSEPIMSTRARARLRGEKVPSLYEVKLIKKDGSTFEAEINARVVNLHGRRHIQTWVRDISERKTSERAIIKAKMEWERTMDAVPDLIAFIDRDYRIVRLNRAMADRLGMMPQEAVGRFCYQLVHGLERPPKDCPHFNALAKNRAAVNMIMPLSRFDGEFELTVVPIYDHGNAIGTVHVAHDVTLHRQAKRELERSFSLLSTTLESTADGILVIGRKGRIEGYNKKFVQMWNIPEEILSTKTIDQVQRLALSQVRSPEYFEIEIEKNVENPETVNHGLFELKDGRIFEYYSQPQRLEEKTVGRVWSMRDVTEKKRAETALKDSEERYRDLFDNISDYIYTHDLDGRFLTVNRAMAENLGYSPQEMIGRKVTAFLPTKYRHLYYDQYLPTLRHEGFSSGIAVFNSHSSGRHYIEYKNSLATNKGGSVYVRGSGRDITDRLLAEKELQALEEQLLHSQKMQAVGTLAGGVAHDFNNILTAILGNLELALTKAGQSQNLVRYLQTAATAAERARELTRHLLTFSRKTESRKKPLNLRDPIDETLHLLGQTIDRRICLSDSIAPDLAQIMADQAQMNQILMNLCVNALDSIDKKLQDPDRPQEDLSITIAAENVLLENNIFEPAFEFEPGQFVQVKVTDNGCGMDEGVRERIFEPFYTTKPRHKGTGLGLSTVYGIVKQHQGWIKVESSPGVGSCFTIYFPAIPATPSPAETGTDQAGLPNGRETILLVDDEPMIREFGQEFLRDLGYRVFLAEDGGEALQIYQSRQQEIDLILLDMVMPRLSGHEVLRRIQSLNPEAKVIISSGHSPEAPVNGIDRTCQPTAFVSKPYHLRELANTIRKVLDGSY